MVVHPFGGARPLAQQRQQDQVPHLPAQPACSRFLPSGASRLRRNAFDALAAQVIDIDPRSVRVMGASPARLRARVSDGLQ
jgi:hypothetical protein